MLEVNQQLVYDITQKYPDPEALFQMLPDDIKRHSLRVAEYTQILYQASIDVEINPFDEETAKERDPMFNYYMYLAGKYHDIGIMCLSEDSRFRREDIKAPELSNDEGHVLYGSALSDNYRKANGYEPKMFWILMAEALRSHHESPDGTGFPDHLTVNKIPLSAWLVSTADKLDNLTAYTHTENPFQYGFNIALDFILGHNLNELELVLRVCEAKLEKAFISHIRETDIITYKPLMVKRTNRRPMNLTFRKVVALAGGKVAAFQSRPVFILKPKREALIFDEVQAKLKEAKIVPAVWKYFLYESSDMRERMNAYGLRDMQLQIPVFPLTLSTAKAMDIVDKWMQETDAVLDGYTFMVSTELMKRPSKSLISNLQELQGKHAKVMLTDYSGGDIPVTGPKAPLKYDIVQLDPVIYDRMTEEIKNSIDAINGAGIEIQADGVDSDDYNELLDSLHVKNVCGGFAGEYMDDEGILTACNTPRRIVESRG